MAASHALRLFVVALATLLSGAPRALASIAVGNEPACAIPCDGEARDADRAGDDACTPLCSTGPCAKVFPSLVSTQFVVIEAIVAHAEPSLLRRESDDVPDGVAASVFHPPRA